MAQAVALVVDVLSQRIARLASEFRELQQLVMEILALEEQMAQLTERGCFPQPKRELSSPRSVMKI